VTDKKSDRIYKVLKEIVERAIHYNNALRRELFVPINCTAIPDTLFLAQQCQKT
jgi:transcriptional regulator with AAA-type ATPase domain